ncbi:hypothetical protein FB567DRAFT_626569 [Paraphoma chrysanthemicola]|uniref:Uncharacterized protein n=1 Tax=Paraphoma chrysanthemicola TaxID=798071 RepID=A0A8K0RBF3_9PLEO|nr:hypothetical protein FB567DRAFT_626569 [Paraphoma chrysanthemicola]
MDAYWEDAVNQEPVLKKSPKWLGMGKCLLVRPFGGFDASLLILSSWPTKASGFDRVGLRTSSMCHVDLCPRRMDRHEIGTAEGNPHETLNPFRLLPRKTQSYWYHKAIEAICFSKTAIVLNLGVAAATAYKKFVRDNKIRVKELPRPGYQPGASSRPLGWLQFEDFRLVRVVRNLFHPEHFLRFAAHLPTAVFL